MRRVLILASTVAGLVALSGCPAKPKSGECKSSKDCLAQEGFGKVCVEGRCQECAADTDCQTGFVCRDNRCQPKPQCQADADCPQGQRCEAEKCVAAREEKPESTAAVSPECAEATAFTIRFGFDQSTLSSDSQGRLQKLADCVKAVPARKLVIEGNADERGTTQYNIALGARRAEAARKYLADLGVSAKLDTVSYGKERPICTDSTEDCWAKNRRDDFQVDR